MVKGNMFVTIDGVDGVGKTTVAQLLVSGCGFKYYKSPGGPFAKLRHEVDNHVNPIARYCFYHLATQHDSNEIRRLLETTSVVCDRYIASTMAYHVALDDRILSIHDDMRLLKPDFSFLLGVDTETRDRRIRERTDVLSDTKLEADSAFLDKVSEVFNSLDLISIDTRDISPAEVAAKIKEVITRGGR